MKTILIPVLALTGTAAFPEPSPVPLEAPSVIGAWASGDAPASCETGPVTLFMSDGVVAVFLSKDGALHSLGSWSQEGDIVNMTHNDFPLSGDGMSKPSTALKITNLTENVFVSVNPHGDERRRIRCTDLTITSGESHGGH